MKMANKNKTFSETLLISEELLKLYSPMSKNVSVDKILPFVSLAQGFYLEPILGRSLLEELQVQIDEDSLTPLNKSLILKIAPVLANYSVYHALRSLTYSITEKGVTLESSDNSRSIELKELGVFLEDVKGQAEMATELLLQYLCRCKENYPLWSPYDIDCCSKYDPTTGKAHNEKMFTVYFPNKKNDCGCGCNGDIWIKKR